jgi:hypothetical protein
MGIEARENVVGVCQRISDEVERVTGLFKDMGGTASEAGDLMTTAMSDPETTAGILQARMTELAGATERLTIAEKEFRDATLAASDMSDVDATALDRQAAATKEYEGALVVATKAQHDARDATEKNMAAQDLANKSTDESAGFLAAAGTKLDKIGPAAAVATAGIIGIAYESAKAASKFNDDIITVANSANISMKAANNIGQAFLDMSTKSIFTASDITQSFGKVAGQLTQVAGHALTVKQSVAFMNVAMQAAAASGQPLSTITSNLAKIMQQYHISLKQAAAGETALYNEGRLTGQNMNMVTQQITRLKGQLGILAPNIEQTASFMLDLTDHGMNARRASQALSSSLNTLLKTSHLTVPTMSEMDAALKKLPPDLQQYGKALLDGKEKVSAFDQQMKNFGKGELHGTVMASYLKSFEGLATQAKSSIGTINALKLSPVQEELSHLGVSVFNSKGNFIGLAGVLAKVGPKLNDMHNKSKELTAATILFGTQAKALLPTILAGGVGYEKAAKAINDQRAMTEASRRAQNNYEADMKKVDHAIEMVRIELGQAFLPILEKVMKEFVKIVTPIADWIQKNKKLTAEILVVVGGITGLITVLWATHKVMSVVSNTFVNFGKDVQKAWTAGGKLVSGIKDIITKMTGLKAANEEAAGTQDALAGSTEGLAVAQGEGAAATEALGDASLAAAPEIDAAGAPVLAIVAAIALLAIAIYELVKHWKTVWGAIKDVATAVWDALKTAWNDFWGFLKAAWDTLLSVGKDIFHTLGIGILVVLGPIGLIIIAVKELVTHWTTIWHTVLSVFDTVASGISKGVHDIISFFTGMPSKILGSISKLGSMLLNFGETSVKDMGKGIVAGAKAIWDFFTALPGKILSLADGVLDDMLHFGENIVKRIISGIENLASGIGKAVMDAIKHIPGIGGLLAKGLGYAGDVVHGAGVVIGGIGHGISSLFHHDGGIINGTPGSDVPAILQAGEGVFTRGQMRALGGMVNAPRFVMGTSGGGDTHVHVHVQGAVYGSLDKFAGELGRHITGTLLPQAGVKLDH